MTAEVIMFPATAALADEGIQILKDSESLDEAYAILDLCAEERGVELEHLFESMRRRLQDQPELLAKVSDLIKSHKRVLAYARRELDNEDPNALSRSR